MDVTTVRNPHEEPDVTQPYKSRLETSWDHWLISCYWSISMPTQKTRTPVFYICGGIERTQKHDVVYPGFPLMGGLGDPSN